MPAATRGKGESCLLSTRHKMPSGPLSARRMCRALPHALTLTRALCNCLPHAPQGEQLAAEGPGWPALAASVRAMLPHVRKLQYCVTYAYAW